MNSTILYLDCDGVILNTIDTAYHIMQDNGLDVSDWRIVHYFFVNTDWNVLIYRSGILKDAIIKIKDIIASGVFKRVAILTKTSGNLEEGKIKKILFGKLLPGVEVITVDFEANKDEVVDPVNNILVEDSVNNAVRWSRAGGVGILFTKESHDYENDVIDDLSDVCKTVGVKKLLKTSNR